MSGQRYEIGEMFNAMCEMTGLSRGELADVLMIRPSYLSSLKRGSKKVTTGRFTSVMELASAHMTFRRDDLNIIMSTKHLSLKMMANMMLNFAKKRHDHAAQELGVTATYLSGCVNGSRPMQIEMLLAVADMTGFSFTIAKTYGDKRGET